MPLISGMAAASLRSILTPKPNFEFRIPELYNNVLQHWNFSFISQTEEATMLEKK